jgi:hypothetical protein
MANRNFPLIFAPSKVTTATRIARIINQDVAPPRAACTVCTDEAGVRAELARLTHQHALVILLAASPQELELMAAMTAWFEDVPLVLMLPDQRRKTVATAHRLRPRYLMGPEINYREMRVVIRNLMARHAKDLDCWARPKSPLLIAGPSKRRYFLLKSKGRTIQRKYLPMSGASISKRAMQKRFGAKRQQVF